MNSCMTKYPFASAYILGVYDAVPEMLSLVNDSNALLEAKLKQLEAKIREHHPNWRRIEMFCHGTDLKEAVHDLILKHGSKLSEKQKHLAMKRVVNRTKHHYSLISLSHQIGKEFINAI